MSIAKVPVFGAQPFGFKATDVSGCKLWLDASDLQTVFQLIPYGNSPGIETLTDSQRFLFWKDKSTGNYDMIRKVAANSGFDPGEPISTSNVPYNTLDNSPEFYGPSIQPANGYAGEVLPKVTFVQYSGAMEGSNTLNTYPEYLSQNLEALGAYNGDIGGNPGPSAPRLGGDPVYNTEVFVVVKPRYLSTPGNIFSIGSKPGKAADFTSLAITSSGYWKINSQGGTRDVTSSSPEQLNLYSNDTNFRLLNMSLSNTNYVLRRNSIQIAQANKSWSPTLSNYQYMLGKRSIGDGADPFDGSIGEVIVFDNIIDNEKRTIVESYLAYKWNLIPLLPENHPARWRDRPIQIGGLSLADAPNEYTRRTRMVKIFVLPPDPATVNTIVISQSGLNIASSWSAAGTGGITDFFNISVFNSTDNSTWTLVQYLYRYTQTSFSYRIASIDNKYYYTQVVAVNLGGAATPVSADSILNSIPGDPSVASPYNNGTNSLYLSWAAGSGGAPITYDLILYSSTDNFASNNVLIYNQLNISSATTNITVTGGQTSLGLFTSVYSFRSRVRAKNGTGSSSYIYSSIYAYPSEGT